MRTIKKIHQAAYSPIADLITYSPLPSRSLDQVDPFLFLNHHGPQVYKPNNNGLPFGPHPHRGMETVTFILEGDIMHKDTGGHESIITAGGIQWMTAGKGLIHAETSSKEFKSKGGNLEILQLWLNLPSKYKMTTPFYKGLQREELPIVSMDEDKVHMQLISGTWNDKKGPFDSLTNVFLSTVFIQASGKIIMQVPAEHNIFFYVVKGELTVNDTQAEARQLVEFNNDGGQLNVTAATESIFLFGHAIPLNEPVIAQGPFVMNTEQEIQEAYNDYRQGKFGKWE